MLQNTVQSPKNKNKTLKDISYLCENHQFSLNYAATLQKGLVWLTSGDCLSLFDNQHAAFCFALHSKFSQQEIQSRLLYSTTIALCPVLYGFLSPLQMKSLLITFDLVSQSESLTKLWILHNLPISRGPKRITAHTYKVFFNCSAQISVLKRKMLFNQRGSFVHQEFHGTESLIGYPSFFILVLKIGRNSQKSTL